jgi:hypothetical protein
VGIHSRTLTRDYARLQEPSQDGAAREAGVGQPRASRSDDATADLLLAVLRGRRDERSWTKLDDNQHAIAAQLVAAGAINEDHGMLARSEQLVYAFDPGQLFGLDW